MLKKYKELVRFEVIIVILLVLNLIYVVAHSGNMFIGKHYSFRMDELKLFSFWYVIVLALSGYAFFRYLSKRVAWNAARVVLDDLPGFMMIADEKIKNYPLLTNKIEILKKEMIDYESLIGGYDSLMSYVRKSYFIIIIFSVLVSVCNYPQVDGVVYTFVEVVFFSVIVLIIYFLSNQKKKKIQILHRKLEMLLKDVVEYGNKT